MKHLLIFGSQGSGKSTWAPYIAEILGLDYLATGDIFRAEIKNGSPIGIQVQDRMKKGIYIDDQTTWEVLKPVLEKTNHGFLLDGYPRNTHQADQLALAGIEFDELIFMILDQEMAIKRLMARGREDDTPAGIKSRLDLYQAQTLPVIEYYRQKGVKITEIDNTPAQEEVKAKIDDYFKK